MDDSPINWLKSVLLFMIAVPLLILFGKSAVLFVLNPEPKLEKALAPKIALLTSKTIHKETAVASVAAAFSTPEPNPTPVVSQRASVIRYLNSGFFPAYFETKSGEQVFFVNESGNAMRIIIEPTGGSRAITTAAPYSVGKNEVYAAMIPERGTYVFYNKNNQGDAGTLVIR